MSKINRHTKRAVVLFSLSPNKESGIKRIANIRSNNSAIFKSLFDHTIDTIQGAKQYINFDLVASTSQKSCLKNVQFIKQHGNGFDERLKNTISDVFNIGYNEIIIVGNDCPDLTPETIQQTFNSLYQNDVVIGPSSDGGFYLIAIKKIDERIFDDVKWYSDKVLSQLLTNINKSHYSHVLLETLNDIDDYADLTHWVERCKTSNIEFCLLLKELLTSYLLLLTVYSVCYISNKSYRTIWQKPPPLR